MQAGSFEDSARPWHVAKLANADIPQTARVLSEAFADNPAYAFMHPRASKRAADLTAFFERNLSWHTPLDLTWIARAPSGEVIGTVTLEPPQGLKRPLREGLSHWAWPTLREQGLHTWTRIMRADAEFTRHSKSTAGAAAYFHVHALAVAPSFQGRGVGVGLMRELLGALPPHTATPVVLSTQRERNVRFYEQFGFVMAQCVHMGRTVTSRGFDSWFMHLGSSQGC